MEKINFGTYETFDGYDDLGAWVPAKKGAMALGTFKAIKFIGCSDCPGGSHSLTTFLWAGIAMVVCREQRARKASWWRRPLPRSQRSSPMVQDWAQSCLAGVAPARGCWNFRACGDRQSALVQLREQQRQQCYRVTTASGGAGVHGRLLRRDLGRGIQGGRPLVLRMTSWELQFPIGNYNSQVSEA